MNLKPHHAEILDKLIRNDFDRCQQSWQKEHAENLIALAAQLGRTDLVTDMCNDI